jgi:hypothetical protein
MYARVHTYGTWQIICVAITMMTHAGCVHVLANNREFFIFGSFQGRIASLKS